MSFRATFLLNIKFIKYYFDFQKWILIIHAIWFLEASILGLIKLISNITIIFNIILKNVIQLK